METSPAVGFPDPEDVLQHLDWVRGLAVRLVGDPAEADDLRQEVWLLAQRLRRPQRIPLRGWLGGLLRNTVRERRRARRTRSYHEEGTALARARSGAESAVVREASLHQHVVERLMSLREPYRSTLLARYFEELSHEEIAERDGVALATVRSRLQRGLNDLREDLGQKRRGHPSVLALLALRTWDPATLGAAPVRTTPWIAPAVAAVSIVGTIGLFALRGDGTEDTLGRGAPGLSQPGGTADADLSSSTLAVTAEPGRVPSPIEVPAPGAAARTGVLVEVIDVAGNTVADVDVFYARSLGDAGWDLAPRTRTDADGRARVVADEGFGMVGCEAPGRIQLGYPGLGGSTPENEHLVVVLAPSTVATGRVVSAAGEPLEGVRLRLGFIERFPAELAQHLDHANLADLDTVTDVDGRFELVVPRWSVALGLIAEKVGYMDARRPGMVFDDSPEPIELTLQPVTDTNVCFGRVTSEAGTPIVGAWVADGERVVRTTEGGWFQLGRVPDGANLWVGAAGYAPREVTRPADLQNLTLELGGDALTLSGVVVFPDGAAAAGLELRLISQQPAGDHYFPHCGRLAVTPLSVEALGVPQGKVPGPPRVTTGPNGEFSIGGLLPRDYDIEVNDPVSLQRIEGLRFPAGAGGVRIEFPELPSPVAGTVRTTDGAALANVLVRSLAAGATFRQGPQVLTDGEGRFAFQRLVRGTRLLVDVPLPWVHVGAVVDGSEHIALEVEPAARVRLTVDLRAGFAGGERRPDVVYVLDAASAPVRFVLDDIRSYRADRLPLEADTRGFAEPLPIIVPVRARTLVFAAAGEPLLELPLDLSPGQDLRLVE